MNTPPPTVPGALQFPGPDAPPGWPDYLASYEALEQHFRAQLEGLTTTEKGHRFATFVQRLVPQTERGSNYGTPELNSKRSDDRGVDLTARAGHSSVRMTEHYTKIQIQRQEELTKAIQERLAAAAIAASQEHEEPPTPPKAPAGPPPASSAPEAQPPLADVPMATQIVQ